MRLKLNNVPEEIIIKYKLHEIATEDQYFYCKIQKGMFGLPQVGIIAQDLLQAHLAKVGYQQSKIIHSLQTHETRKICFTLVIDDFAIKYTSMEDPQHLIDALKQDYTFTFNWDATKYIELTLEWYYKNQKVYAHMRGYIQKALLQFKHQTPKTKQTSPHQRVKPQYGAKAHMQPTRTPSPPSPARRQNMCKK